MHRMPPGALLALVGKALVPDLHQLVGQLPKVGDGVLREGVQAVVVQSLQLRQLVVCQQGLAHAGGVGWQAAALHRDGVAVQGAIYLFR